MENYCHRRALLIGINRYPFFRPEYQLRGCINDVALLREFLLEAWNFPAGSIRELLDEAATVEAIRRELAFLGEQASEGSWIVIYFSGHGSRRPDARADRATSSTTCRAGDELDGWDETWVPHDSGRAPYPSCDLVDDEIRGHLKAILDRGAGVMFVADSCRSGTVYRDPFEVGTQIRQVPPDERRPDSFPDFPRIDRTELFATGRLHTLCACYDHQFAIELETSGKVHGAFTYNLVRTLATLPSGATFADLRERMQLRLQSGFSNQWPRFEGDLGRALPVREASYRPDDGLAYFAKRRLKIELSGEQRDCLREALARSEWLEEASPQNSAWAKLEWIAERRETLVVPADDRKRFILSRSGGDPLLVSDELDPGAVVSALERQARHAFLLALENTDPGQPPHAAFELNLLTAGARGDFQPIAEIDSLAALSDGERLGIRLVNRGREPFHLGILLFGTSGAVSMLYPCEGMPPPLAPGCALELGMGLRWTYTIAAHRPPWRAPPPCGDIEQIKIFASRGPWPWPTWLEDLRARPLAPPVADPWITFSRSFLLQDRPSGLATT
jgi:hypothetical protein